MASNVSIRARHKLLTLALLITLVATTCGADPAVRAPEDEQQAATTTPTTASAEAETEDDSEAAAESEAGADEASEQGEQTEPTQDAAEEGEPGRPLVTGVIGGETVGDPYYPTLGNTGYDVSHYELNLRVDIDGTDQLVATAVIDLTATEDLVGFSLDLQDEFKVDQVLVDDVAASFELADDKLRISTSTPLAAGTDHVVVVDYSGEPMTIDSTTRIGLIGWYDLSLIHI